MLAESEFSYNAFASAMPLWLHMLIAPFHHQLHRQWWAYDLNSPLPSHVWRCNATDKRIGEEERTATRYVGLQLLITLKGYCWVQLLQGVSAIHQQRK